MSKKSYIYDDNYYLDTSGIVHNRQSLDNVINKVMAVASATISSEYTLNGTIDIELTKFLVNNDNFTLSDGGIVCPYDGIISISASAMISPRTGYVGFQIYKGSTNIVNHYEPAGSQTYGGISFSNYIEEVSAGDVIYLKIGSNASTDKVTNSARTRLTIMYVDVR